MSAPARAAADPARPALGWSDLAGARVGVWGLRTEGIANLRRLRRLGIAPVLVDDAPSAPAFGGIRVLQSRAGGLEALLACDVVVKSPGISRRSPEVGALVDAGVAVAGGIGLWLQDADRERVVCITGTKGKSTTAALAGHVLGRLGHRCLVAGNIGVPPWDPGAGDDWDLWVVEVSSYQATDIATAPPVVAVTSLGPDHLDWHGSLEGYYTDKLSLCSRPGASRTVADGASDVLRAREGLLGPSVRWVDVGDPELDGPWADGVGVPGRHYRRDALIARACLVELGIAPARDPERMADAIGDFHPLEHRFHPIGTVTGVAFIDDGLSTNILPALGALGALGTKPVALLVGGHDRGIDYGELAGAVAARRHPTFVATLPAAGARIGAAVRAAVAERSAHARTGAGAPVGPGSQAEAAAHGDAAVGGGVEVADFDDLATATRAAFEWARPLGGTVLLSPAAPSFGQFRDYRERSAAFAAAMAACAPQSAPAASEMPAPSSARPEARPT